jgi:hypothetical protein
MGEIMIEYIKISMALLFFAIFLMFNCKEVKVKGPSIRFESKVYEFGEAKRGDTISHTFSFFNTGSDTLILENVHPSCPSCTNIDEYDKIIAPGGKGKISVTYKVGVSSRYVEHKIYIKTNIPDGDRIILTLNGNILGEKRFDTIVVIPETLNFGRMEPTDSIRVSKVRVKNYFENPLYITGFIPPNEKTEVSVETVQRGKQYIINIRLHSPFKEGENRETITLETNLKEKPEILVPYIYSFHPEEWLKDHNK